MDVIKPRLDDVGNRTRTKNKEALLRTQKVVDQKSFTKKLVDKIERKKEKNTIHFSTFSSFFNKILNLFAFLDVQFAISTYFAFFDFLLFQSLLFWCHIYLHIYI